MMRFFKSQDAFLNNMKRGIACMMGCLALLGCHHDENAVLIEGSIKNIRQAELFLISDMGATQRIDTIYVRDGEFKCLRPLQEGQVLTLLFPNFFELPLVVNPGDELHIKSDATHLAQTIVKGSPDNELLTDFRIAMDGKSESEQSLAAQQFIYDNVSTQAALVLFKRYFVRPENPVVEEARPLLDTLRKTMPDNAVLRELSQTFALRSLTAEGQPVPELEEISMDGDTIRSEQFKGKPTVFTFWSTWTREHRAFIKTVAQAERDFKDKVNFLHISLDASKQKVETALRFDSLQSPIICDQEALASPLISAFGIEQVPQILIADKEGKFIKRNVSVQQLKEELQKILE